MNKFSFQCCVIDADCWKVISKKALSSRTSFFNEMIKIIMNQDLSLCPKIQTVIVFPKETTIKERHSIHYYSIKNHATSKSKDKNGERIIKLTLSGEHVCKCVKNFK